MSNLPPGVTGNEYQIAGPDREWDDYRECSSEGFTVRTIDLYGEGLIQKAIEMLNGTGNITVAVSYLRTALSDIETVDVDGECPFGSDVTLQTYHGIESWECPICRTMHETEVE